MVSSVLSCLVCVLCVIVLPAVWADYCSSYWDTDGQYHDDQQCSQYCCGNCNQKYCCNENKYRLTQGKQDRCSGRPSYAKNHIPMLLGSILGTIFPIIFCVSLIVCCVAPCCLCYKKCRKGQRPQTVATIVNLPQQPTSPSGYQPSYPGYQPVPVQPGYVGPPIPTAPPPSYMEATDPAYPPAFSQGQLMYPYSNQLYGPPPNIHELDQLPYNPSYCPNP
ncbi:protein shisa-5 [Dicentrarchus labrax]|uniref:Protein shisa-5 n=1 Tax=Dicentrarchus labrax TaxID=13489 RepID=E6ZFA8_DICLA|nr:protein shisa-5 [Dicentrarchus labrax]CBN80858.1 Protein shisa-5 [Dicentrarchus labrax]